MSACVMVLKKNFYVKTYVKQQWTKNAKHKPETRTSQTLYWNSNSQRLKSRMNSDVLGVIQMVQRWCRPWGCYRKGSRTIWWCLGGCGVVYTLQVDRMMGGSCCGVQAGERGKKTGQKNKGRGNGGKRGGKKPHDLMWTVTVHRNVCNQSLKTVVYKLFLHDSTQPPTF